MIIVDTDKKLQLLGRLFKNKVEQEKKANAAGAFVEEPVGVAAGVADESVGTWVGAGVGCAVIAATEALVSDPPCALQKNDPSSQRSKAMKPATEPSRAHSTSSNKPLMSLQ